MARERVSQRMQKEIQSLHERGYSRRAIARILKVSRKTVRKFIFHETAPIAAAIDVEPTKTIDWKVVVESYAKGVTLSQLHREYAEESSYLSFWRAFRRLKPVQPEVTLKLDHQPAERSQIDFTDGISVVDRETGLIRKTQLFVGVLPFSSYTFGEFVLDQKLPTFLGVQDRMFAFFGGVTPYVVVDNLRSGVSRAHRYDPEVNPTYCEYGRHMGFAVLPARPYTPKDKAACECMIGVIQKQFYQEVRNQKFYSLAELNGCFRLYLERLNRAVMKDYGISRSERFESEKKLLKPLPAERFERTEWSFAKVHPDCHIQVGRNFYSVPFRWVGHTVRVRRSEKLLEIFSSEGEALAAHALIEGQHRFSTRTEHYPDEKLGVARFEISHAKKQAEAIGPQTASLVEKLFNDSHPLRYLRRVQGLLRLKKSFSAESLEYGCRQALHFQKYSLAYIQNCVKHFEQNGNRLTLVSPKRDLDTLHLHQRKEIPS